MEEQLTQASAHVSQVAADECGPTMVHHLSPTQAAQAVHNRQGGTASKKRARTAVRQQHDPQWAPL